MWRRAVLMMLVGGAVMADETRPFAAFSGASDAVLADPHDLAFGPDGMLYIADKFANRVAIMDPETLEVTGSIGDGLVTGAHDVSFAPDGRLYVAATGLSAVAVFDLSGSVPEVEGSIALFLGTEGVLAHSNGQVYVMATGTGRLYSVDGTTVVAEAGNMRGSHDLAEANDGTIWVADPAGHRLVRFSPNLERLQTIEGAPYGFAGPRYLDVDADGNLIVADQDAHRVLKIDPVDGAVLGVIGSGLPGLGPNLRDDPEGVAVRGGEFYFSDSDNNRIVKYVVALN